MAGTGQGYLRQAVGKYLSDTVPPLQLQVILPAWVMAEITSVLVLLLLFVFGWWNPTGLVPAGARFTLETKLPMIDVFFARPADSFDVGNRPVLETKSHTAPLAPLAKLMPSVTWVRIR